MRAAEPQLHSAKPTFQQHFRLIGDGSGSGEAKTIAVVGAQRARRSAEIGCEWEVRGDRERVPAGNIQPGKSHADDALHADQPVAPSELGGDVERSKPIALHCLERILQHVGDRSRRRLHIAEQIRAPDDPLFGFKVDEQQRRGADGLRARPERTRHRHFDGHRPDGP